MIGERHGDRSLRTNLQIFIEVSAPIFEARYFKKHGDRHVILINAVKRHGELRANFFFFCHFSLSPHLLFSFSLHSSCKRRTLWISLLVLNGYEHVNNFCSRWASRLLLCLNDAQSRNGESPRSEHGNANACRRNSDRCRG